MLKLPVEEMQLSTSDAALSQPDMVPSMVAAQKPVCVHFWSRRVHVSQVNSDSAPPMVCTKLFVALQFKMYSGLDNTVVVRNNEVAMFTTLVGPAKRLDPVSTKAEDAVPTAAPLSFPPCKIHWPTARPLQVGVRENFRALRALDTTKWSEVSR